MFQETSDYGYPKYKLKVNYNSESQLLVKIKSKKNFA
jgi:hypothetical protein